MLIPTTRYNTRDAIRAGHEARAEAFLAFLRRLTGASSS